MQDTIIRKLNLNNKRLSKGHRRIAAFIEEHYDKAVYMTAARVGELVDVSESTVVRFAIAMGYEGYPQMQRTLREIVRHRLTSTQRISIHDEVDEGSLPEEVLRNDMRNIKANIDSLDHEVFRQVVDTLCEARTHYILGLRSAAPMAQFMAYYLHYIFPDVRLIDNTINDTFETVARIQPGDVLIAISFPRYSNRTLESTRFARTRGVKVIGITDGELSPLHATCDLCLDARTEMASFADSLAAPLSLINALIAALGQRNREAIQRNFTEMEQVWDAFRIYASNDA